jgi:hypothetical protein
MTFLPRITLQDLLGVLVVSAELFRQRVAANELALSFGAALNPERGQFLAIDAFSMLLASMLQSQGLSWRVACLIVRESWEIWLRLLAATEDHLTPGVYPPASKQLFFACKVAVDRHPIVVGAQGMDTTLDRLDELTKAEGGDWPLPPVGVSISACLRALRVNERQSGVQLPARLTVPEGHANFERFLAEGLGYKKASDARLRAKAKGSKNARRALREMAAQTIVREAVHDE